MQPSGSRSGQNAQAKWTFLSQEEPAPARDGFLDNGSINLFTYARIK
jgi:hypothetical protein